MPFVLTDACSGTARSDRRRLAPVLTAITLTALATGGCSQLSFLQPDAAAPQATDPTASSMPQTAPPIPADHTAVLAAGTQVVAQTAEGTIRIEAGPGLRRVFEWDGHTRAAIVKARQKAFASGPSKGLTYDGTPPGWAGDQGITKLRYEEGERHFKTGQDAQIWLQIRRLYYTYNDHGLVVGWKRDGHTLHVEVWRFLVDGHRPASLPGSRDARIETGPIPAKTSSTAASAPAARSTPSANGSSAPTTSGGASSEPANQASPGWFQTHIAGPLSRVFGG